MDDLAAVAKIDDPTFYNDPYGVYARLRSEAPVMMYPPLNIWVLTKYDDIRDAARQPEIFSNTGGIFSHRCRAGGVRGRRLLRFGRRRVDFFPRPPSTQ